MKSSQFISIQTETLPEGGMTSLLLDVSRCVGRFGLGPDDPICPRRDQCARYLAIKTDRERWPNGYPPYVPVATGLCRDGDDFYIGGDVS